MVRASSSGRQTGPVSAAHLREVAVARTAAQRISVAGEPTVAATTRAMLGTQAQDLAAATWALALRTPGADAAAVQAALADRSVVRGWPARGTLFLVAADDLRWLTQLLAPRSLAASTGLWRRAGLEPQHFSLAEEAVVAALAEHGELSRPDLLGAVARHGVDTAGERGSHLLRWLSARCVIVFAAPRGTQQRFALFEEWIPGTRRIDDREEALAEYVRRWLARRGPATVRDLAWWGGLTLTEARHAVSLVADVETTVVDGETWIERTEGEAEPGRPARGDLRLLPSFDELLLGYGGREASLDPADASRLVPSSNGLFLPAVTVDGRVVGTWRRTVARGTVAIEVDPWVAWTERRRAQVRRRAEQYAQHLGLALAEGPASSPTSP
jgi:hypothetical protein